MKLKLASLHAVFLLCSILFCRAQAQNLQITGTVTKKSTGEPLKGASVSARGTTIATTTDQAGNYSLSVPQKVATIVVTYVDMAAMESRVTQSGVVNFSLEERNTTLSDVVVIGYGTQKITKVSGALSTVKAGDIAKLNPVRTEEALQGMASGVNVIQSGSPGSKPTVQIRGIPSFSGNDPLVIVDGVQQSLDDLNSLNPSDIENLTVLKDAATTAIYGVKGGNGVIVITTKGGRKGQKTQFGINSNYGTQEVLKTIGMLNATEYGAMVNEGSTLAGGPVIFPDLSVLGAGTNWQDQIFHRAPVQTYGINASGGSDRVTFFLSGGYLSQGGIVGGYDKSRFNRATFTANTSFELTSKLKFILNATYVNLDTKGVQENSFNSIIGSALNFDPTVSVLNTVPNTVGKYGFSNLLLSEIFNPLTKLDNTYNKNIGSKLYGKFEFQYDVLKNLKLTTRFGYTKYDDNGKSFSPLVFYGPLNVENTLNADGSTVSFLYPDGSVGYKHNSVSSTKVSNFNFTYEAFGNYNFNIKKDHHFETVAGFSASRVSGNAAGATRQDVPFNSWTFADYTSATGVNTANNPDGQGGYYYQYATRNVSFFGRVNYDYQDRYLASVSGRRDGSSVFGPENKYVNLFAGSLGWVASKESFFKSNFINFLKIRGSYGTTANDNVSPQLVSIITGGPSYGPTANSNGYTFDNIFYPGSTVGTAANAALHWEKNTQGNAGFDMTFYKNKFNLSADVFQKKTDGLLFTPSASLYLGTVPIPVANIGSTKSTGLDITLGYKETIAKAVHLTTSLTFTTSKNVVTATNTDGTAKVQGGSYFNGQSQLVTMFQKGYTPGYFYGYKTAGLFQTEAEVKAAPTQTNAKPGDIRFVDVNKDGVINADDQTKIGDPFPNFTMGWNFNVEYKHFDFSAFTYASVGNDVYRAYERNANYSNKYRDVLARWTGPGTTNDARHPRYTFQDDNSNIRVSDRYVEDGSFIKIKNLQLGYSFQQNVIKRIFKGLRIYAQVKNAYTFTKYSGFDPEISGGTLETGVDRGAYPQARTYAVGLDIKL